MKKNNRQSSLKSTKFRRLAESLVWHVGQSTSGTGSVCSCSNPPFACGDSANVRCPNGMPWGCARQMELFPEVEGETAPETGLPPACNTGVTRPESAQGEQKANKILAPTKAASK